MMRCLPRGNWKSLKTSNILGRKIVMNVSIRENSNWSVYYLSMFPFLSRWWQGSHCLCCAFNFISSISLVPVQLFILNTFSENFEGKYIQPLLFFHNTFTSSSLLMLTFCRAAWSSHHLLMSTAISSKSLPGLLWA